jgi:hypothetical protein
MIEESIGIFYILNMDNINYSSLYDYINNKSNFNSIDINDKLIELFILYYKDDIINEFIISVDKLLEFNIIKKYNDFKLLISKYNLILNQDYYEKDNKYIINFNTFKYCIILSNNINSKHFILLEKYLYEYQLYKINILKEENFSIKEDIKYINDCNIEKDKIIFNLKNTNLIPVIDDIFININKSNIQQEKKISECFVLMKESELTYYVIRSQKKNIHKLINKKQKIGYSLIEFEDTSNAVFIWNIIKDALLINKNIKCVYNNIYLLNISDYDFITTIKHIFIKHKENINLF